MVVTAFSFLAYDMIHASNNEETILSGCYNIDNLLENGIPLGSITEISGESGCGKSQVCLSTAVQSLIKGKSMYQII